MKKPKAKFSLISHVIWPLIGFAAGIMVAAALGVSPESTPSAAPGTQQRLVELMGRVNDLENTVSDLERQLRDSQAERELLAAEVTHTREQLEEATERVAAAVAEKGEGGAVKEDWSKEVEEEAAWAAQVAKSGHGAVKWSKLGRSWQTTDLEPLSFMKKFDIGLPTETIKWSGGMLLIPNSLSGKGGLESAGTALDHIQNQCSELDVSKTSADANYCLLLPSQANVL